jgi:hypothetical protein
MRRKNEFVIAIPTGEGEAILMILWLNEKRLPDLHQASFSAAADRNDEILIIKV